MTQRGERPSQDVDATRAALQDYADETMGNREMPRTYRRSRLKFVAGGLAVSLAAVLFIAPRVSGGNVEAKAPGTDGPVATASGDPTNPNTAGESGLTFDCELTSVNGSSSGITGDFAPMTLMAKTTGRDHVSYHAVRVVEGTVDASGELPLIGGEGAGDSTLTAQIPRAAFERQVALYAVSGEGDSTLCGAFKFVPGESPEAQFSDEQGVPTVYEP